MNPKKIAAFLAVCIGTALITIVLLKVLNQQIHLRDRLGITSTK